MSASHSHPVIAPKKLIEVALPLDEINKAAAREKSIHRGAKVSSTLEKLLPFQEPFVRGCSILLRASPLGLCAPTAAHLSLVAMIIDEIVIEVVPNVGIDSRHSSAFSPN